VKKNNKKKIKKENKHHVVSIVSIIISLEKNPAKKSIPIKFIKEIKILNFTNHEKFIELP
jgi:hypothetical protein